MLSVSHGLAPPPSLSSLSLSAPLLQAGGLGMGLVEGERSGGGPVERLITQCFSSSALLGFISLLPLPWASGDRGKEKEKNRGVHLPCSATTTAPFYLSSEGPNGAGGQALWKGSSLCVWGGGYQGPPALAWKLLSDVSVRQRTVVAIVGLTGREL